MRRLLLIRHAESLWSREKRYAGWTDVDLSDRGVEEAREAGLLLKRLGFEVDLVFTSRLKRTIRTAWLMLEAMDQAWIPVHPVWQLNERHCGALTGLTREEAIDRFGRETASLWFYSHVTPPAPQSPGDRHEIAFDRRYDDVDPRLLPQCECFAQAATRIVDCWTDSIAPALSSGKQIAVVSHSGVLRMLFDHLGLFGSPTDEIADFRIPTAVPLLICFDDDLKPITYEFLCNDANLSP